MVYLRNVDVRVGALVLYQDPRSLEPWVCVIVDDGRDAVTFGKGFVTLLTPNGSRVQANRQYLRRVPDESR